MSFPLASFEHLSQLSRAGMTKNECNFISVFLKYMDKGYGFTQATLLIIMAIYHVCPYIFWQIIFWVQGGYLTTPIHYYEKH
jgi:hypothetical protein